jgi:glutamate synthase (NADPH) small chain
VIGAGPAGLACADVLVRAGAKVTVYDRAAEPGGLLSSAIPSFKLQRAMVQRRCDVLQDLGVRFNFRAEIGTSDMKRLLADADAVFIATGAPASRGLDIPGKKLSGVVGALRYLAAPEGWHSQTYRNRVIVLGGGETAIDCARTAIRQGAASVTVAYRGARERMRASRREIDAALKDGVVFRYGAGPIAFAGEAKLEGVILADGEKLHCDLAIEAIGQTFDPPHWVSTFGIRVDGEGRILVDGDGRTTHPRVFAGGDNTSGPGLVVLSAAAGRRAANAILAGQFDVSCTVPRAVSSSC